MTDQRVSESSLRPGMAELLELCHEKGGGCFADHPRVLADLQHGVGDAYLYMRGARTAAAAVWAGKAGLPIDEASYLEVTMETVPGSEADLRFGDGERVNVDPRSKIVSCAYACGKAATCPLID